MLPPFIIEQIRRREEEARQSRRAEQPRLELPIDVNRIPREREPGPAHEEAERGILILDI